MGEGTVELEEGLDGGGARKDEFSERGEIDFGQGGGEGRIEGDFGSFDSGVEPEREGVSGEGRAGPDEMGMGQIFFL